LVETQSGKKIKVLRTNNGGEHVNHEIHNIFHEAGIHLHHTVPYTLQQNEVVERKNIYLKEMASCMLHTKSLPHRLLAKELNCVTYIQNKSPHRSVKDNTPYEAWSSLKSEVTHFCIFGSHAWAQIPSEKRKALDPESTECIFVGFPEGVKGYRLIDLSSYQLIIEKSVQFEESVSHVPQQSHPDTFIVPPFQHDEHAHADSSSDESSDLEYSDDPNIESVHSNADSKHPDAYAEPVKRPKWHILIFRMQGILLLIQLILGGLDLFSRSLLFHSLPLNHFPPEIFSWFNIHIHSLMVRLLEIHFGNPPCRRSKTPSSRTKIGIWFTFLLEGNLCHGQVVL
jgi:hypothetical protein